MEDVYRLIPLVSIAVDLTLGIYILTRDWRLRANRLFFLITVALSLWGLGELMMRSTTDPSVGLAAGRVAGLGWCFVGVLFLHFTLELTDWDPSWKGKAALASIYAISLAIVALTLVTHLVFRRYAASPYGGVTEVGGPLRMFTKVLVVCLFLAGIAVLVRYRTRATRREERIKIDYVIVAATIPLAVGLVTDVILPALGRQSPFSSQAAGPWMAIVIAIGVSREGLMTTVTRRMGPAVLSSMKDAVLVAGRDGTIETVNPAALALTGYTEDEIVGKRLEEVMVGLEFPRVDRVAEHAGEAALVDRAETSGYLLAADGRVVPVVWSMGAVTGKTGRATGAVVTVHDMRETMRLLEARRRLVIGEAEVEAERARAELILRSSQELGRSASFMASVLENIAEPIWIKDRDMRFIYVNRQFSLVTGISREEVVGRRDEDFYWADIAAEHEEEQRRTLETGEALVMDDLPMPDGQGVTHYVRLVSAPVRGETGRIEFLVGSVTDRTTQKELEQSRLDFIRIAAHELRTPLTSLKLSLELLTRETHGSLSEDEQRSLDVLSLSIERLSRLSRNLLDLATMDAGLMTLNLQPVDLGALFAETRAVFERAAMEKGLEITCEVETSRPANADAARLSQVLYNLVSNAVKFTDEGGVRLACADEPSGEIRASVSDTGCGIPHDKQEAVFSRFVKAQSAETAVEGTGLGLSIANEIVEAHGGRIKVRSEPGSGSVFTFTLKPWEEEG